MNTILIAEKLTDIDERYILESDPTVGVVLFKQSRFAALSRFLSSGVGAAVISGVVALGVLVAIVMAGRNPPNLPPFSTEDSTVSENTEDETTSEPVSEEVSEDTVIDIGVETAEGNERHGYAASNVASLAYYLLDPGVTVTYIAETNNPASMRVAEKVGFRPTAKELRLVGYRKE